MKGIWLVAAGFGSLLVVSGCGSAHVQSNHTQNQTEANQVVSNAVAGSTTDVANASSSATNSKVPQRGKYHPGTLPTLPKKQYKTSVPVVLLKEKNVSNPSVVPHPPKRTSVDLPPSLAKDFVAYFAYRNPSHPLYIVLPRGIKPINTKQNIVGEDGSFFFEFAGRDGLKFVVISNGPCEGCSAADAAPFFSNAEKINIQDGGSPTPSLKEKGAAVTYPKSDLALYSYKSKGQAYVGFNQFDDNFNHYWGKDFSASFQGKSLNYTDVQWALENLIEQNK